MPGALPKTVHSSAESEFAAVAPALAPASGEEQPVRSPALELQEALEKGFATHVPASPRPARVVMLCVGLLAVAGVCGAFWLWLARMLISLH